jgi:threonylcarbamoyladenosine tRNA methylthiotransferase MtaB
MADNVKTVVFYTLGCKVNQYETQSIRKQFENKKSYKEVPFCFNADIYVINTCVVTKESARKSNYIARKIKKRNLGACIIITGCSVSGINKKKIFPLADFVVDNKNKNHLVDLFEKKEISDFTNLIDDFSLHTRAFLKIQDGCDSFCSYCVIPYVRGSIKSRDIKDIYQEIDLLANKDYKEIVLTGIHIGKFGKDTGQNILDILKYIEKKEQILRLRLSSFEPMEITDELIDFIKTSKKVCKHFHIPLQSGDNYILKQMNRNYNVEMYKEKIDKIKCKLGKSSVSTDIIVGFPGETFSNFENTLNAVKDIGFNKVHIFTYSDRDTTKAYKFKNKIGEIEKKERYNILCDVVKETTNKIKQGFTGKKVPVLIEKISDEKEFFGRGYSDLYFNVKVKNKNVKINEIFDVEIKDYNENELIGV